MVSRNRRLGLEQLERRHLLAVTIVPKSVSGTVECEASCDRTYDLDRYPSYWWYPTHVSKSETQPLESAIGGWQYFGVQAACGYTRAAIYVGNPRDIRVEAIADSSADSIAETFFVTASVKISAVVEYEVIGTPDVPVGSQFVFTMSDHSTLKEGDINRVDVWAPAHSPRVGGLYEYKLSSLSTVPEYYVATVGQTFSVHISVETSLSTHDKHTSQRKTNQVILFGPVDEGCALGVNSLSWDDEGLAFSYTVVGDIMPPQPTVQFFWTQDDPTSPTAAGPVAYEATLADFGHSISGTKRSFKIPYSVLGPAPFSNGYLAIRPPRATWANNVRVGVPFAIEPPGAVDGVNVLVFPGGPTGENTATLTWSPPTKTGFSPITDYVVQYSDNSGSTWTTYGDGVSTATSATVRGLASDTGYIFRVIAVNAAGNGQEAWALTPIAPEAKFVFTPVASETITDSITRTGTAQIVKHGTGTLILDRPNTHSGGTIVGDGKLIVRDPMALGSGPVVVLAGATLKIDLAGGNVPVGMLTVEPGGAIDLGYGRMTFSAGTSLASIRDLLQRGYSSGWNGTDGFVSGAVGSVMGGSVGYLNNADGTLTVAFGATGDVNLDGVVDILDISIVVASGKFDAGVTSTWAEGDFNYDNVVDLLDISDFFSVPLFDAGPYIPAQALRVQDSADISPMTAYDSVFLMLASEEGIASIPSVKKPRLVKAGI
jgi:autotransporter-associated beta strand protein